MEAFLEALVLFFIPGLIIGWILNARAVTRRILSNPERAIRLIESYKKTKHELDNLKSIKPLDITEVKVEQVEGLFYLYASSGEFLGQGSSLEDALTAVGNRFPGQNFAGHIPAEQAKEMGLSKQQ
jgi:hypothetical protein